MGQVNAVSVPERWRSSTCVQPSTSAPHGRFCSPQTSQAYQAAGASFPGTVEPLKTPRTATLAPSARQRTRARGRPSNHTKIPTLVVKRYHARLPCVRRGFDSLLVYTRALWSLEDAFGLQMFWKVFKARVENASARPAGRCGSVARHPGPLPIGPSGL